MINYPKKIWAALGAFLVVGCGNVDSAHLVFGQQQTVGLDITATAPEQGGSLSLGYKDKNIAVIPVAVKGEDGLYQLLGSTNKLEGGANTGELSDENDAFSTIGQFELNTGENGTASVGLGKFFATGLAAQKLADGFKAELSE